MLTVLHQGEFSPGEVAEILDEDVRYVTGHINDLYDAGCIEFVNYRLVGSRSRPIFRAVVLPEITYEVWRLMSIDDRHDASGAIVQGFLAESLSSHRNRRMAEDEDPCLIWDAHKVDALGKAEINDVLTAAKEEVLSIEGRSINRMAKSGESGTTIVVGLFGFIRGRSGRPKSGYYRARKS